MNTFRIKKILLSCVFVFVYPCAWASQTTPSSSATCAAPRLSQAAIVRNLLLAQQKEFAEKNNDGSQAPSSVLAVLNQNGSIEAISQDPKVEMFRQKIDPFIQKIISLLNVKHSTNGVSNATKDELFQCIVESIKVYLACGYDYKRFQDETQQTDILRWRQTIDADNSGERLLSHIDILFWAFTVIYPKKTVRFERMIPSIFCVLQLTGGVNIGFTRADEIEHEISLKKAEIANIDASLNKNKKKLAMQKKEQALIQAKQQKRLALEAEYKEKRETERIAKEAKLKEQQSQAQRNKIAKEQAQAEAALRKKERNKLRNEQGVLRAKRLAALEKLQHYGQEQNRNALMHRLNQWKRYVSEARKIEQQAQEKEEHAMRAALFDALSLKSFSASKSSSLEIVPTTYDKKLKKETKEQAWHATILSNVIVALHTGSYPMSRNVQALDLVDLSDKYTTKITQNDLIDKNYYKAMTHDVDSRLWVQEHLRTQIESYKNVQALVPPQLQLRKGGHKESPFSFLCYTCKNLGLIVPQGITQHK